MTETADIVIVGGGCMGASVAFHLARHGAGRVVLLEKEEVLGAGSTGRNAGGVRHQFSHPENVRLSIESIAFMERFEEETGSPLDFAQDGYLFLLETEESLETFRRNAAMQKSLGVEVEILGADEAAALAPGLDVTGIKGATFCGRDGIADPGGLTTGLSRAARARGAEVRTGVEVVGVHTRSGRVTGVETTQGRIDCPVLVNAAGPWASRLGGMASLEIPVVPYRRHIYLAAPSRSAGTARVPDSRIMVIDFATTFYFHREGPNVLFGMGVPDEEPTFDTSVDDAFLERVIPVATRRLPALADAALSTTWAGLYEVTPDAMPILGEHPGCAGFFLINGFSGHGFQHAPAAGRIVADLILGRDPGLDLRPFAFERFAAKDGAGERNVV
jgi:sarcosine oxidase subunit beta